tara:strand:- start:498 stop:728 length:231 start_codon:yes stop_codon:yes gene_type:complete
MKSTTVIIIDIKEFAKETKDAIPEKIAHYLKAYYELIAKNITPLGWKMIKTMGDSVIVTAPNNNSETKIKNFYTKI